MSEESVEGRGSRGKGGVSSDEYRGTRDFLDTRPSPLGYCRVTGVRFQTRSADMMEGVSSGECTYFNFAC